MKKRDNFFKRHPRLTVFFAVLLVLFTAAATVLGVEYLNSTAQFRIWGEVVSAEVRWAEYEVFSVTADEREEIDTLLSCIDGVWKNNITADPRICIAPIMYRITYRFKNGSEKEYVYNVYPFAREYKQPFKPFLELESIKAKLPDRAQ